MEYSAVFYISAEYFISPPELVHPDPENCHTPRRISGALVLYLLLILALLILFFPCFLYFLLLFYNIKKVFHILCFYQ